jgi:hypothetical protein
MTRIVVSADPIHVRARACYRLQMVLFCLRQIVVLCLQAAAVRQHHRTHRVRLAHRPRCPRRLLGVWTFASPHFSRQCDLPHDCRMSWLWWTGWMLRVCARWHVLRCIGTCHTGPHSHRICLGREPRHLHRRHGVVAVSRAASNRGISAPSRSGKAEAAQRWANGPSSVVARIGCTHRLPADHCTPDRIFVRLTRVS